MLVDFWYYLSIYCVIQKQKNMCLASLSLVIIFLITVSLMGIQRRLVQHRTTRQDEGREIPNWLNSMIDCLSGPICVWEFSYFIGIILFSIKLCQFNHYLMIMTLSMIFFIGVISIVPTFLVYKLTGSITSRHFSRKIFEQYHENTVPEC